MDIPPSRTRPRSFSNPGLWAQPAARQALKPPGARLPASQPATPESSRLVVAGFAPAPRLVAAVLDEKAPADDPYDPYDPVFSEKAPSLDHSPELLDPAPSDGKGIVMVEQSRGAASATRPLVTRNLIRCSVALIVNLQGGQAYMAHLDSGARSRWPSVKDEKLNDEKRPVSPATPRSGLLGRGRFNYEAFMGEPGDKVVLLVESERSYDRTEQIQQIVARGAMPLKPLTLKLGACPELAFWHMAYRPRTDELIVHLEGAQGSSVMHFRGLVTHPVDAPEPDGYSGNLANSLTDYKAHCATLALDSKARDIVDTCLAIIELRNVNLDLAHEQLDKLRKLPGVPPNLLGTEVVHLLEKDSPIVPVLTGLVDKYLLASGP